MTERQAIAIANPINFADANALARFAQTVRAGQQSYGTILTVHRDDGLYWHARVSVLSVNLKPVPVTCLSTLQQRAAERVARELLDNVGCRDSEELKREQKSFLLIR